MACGVVADRSPGGFASVFARGLWREVIREVTAGQGTRSGDLVGSCEGRSFATGGPAGKWMSAFPFFLASDLSIAVSGFVALGLRRELFSPVLGAAARRDTGADDFVEFGGDCFVMTGCSTGRSMSAKSSHLSALTSSASTLSFSFFRSPFSSIAVAFQFS